MALVSLVSLSLLQVAWTAAITRPEIRQTADTVLCSAPSVQVATNATQSTVWPWQTFRSSDAVPPMLSIDATGEPLFDGLLIFDTAAGGATPGTKAQAPLIMTDTGELVWFGPLESISNLRVQTFNGAEVLTYFSGQGTAGTAGIVGHGFGKVLVLDDTYTTIHTVCPVFQDFTLPPGVTAECHADVHESLITDRNTMLVTAYNQTTANLTSVGGPANGYVIDSIAAEVNMTTNEVLFTWSPLAHVPVNQSHYPLLGAGRNASDAYDFFHINAIQRVGDNYLINSRHTWSTYLVNPQGEILWEINGATGGDFGPLPEGGTFSWQHFARLEQVNSSTALLHYFANNNYDFTTAAERKPSTGLSLLLPLPLSNSTSRPAVALSTNLTDETNVVSSWSQGDFQFLPNGNSFIGYGADGVMIEYGPQGIEATKSSSGSTEGRPVWTGTFAYGDLASSYRAYKQAWHATPATKPDLAVVDISVIGSGNDPILSSCGQTASASQYRGFVSWNGATNVTAWEVYAGSSNTTLKPVGTAAKAGFETEFVVPAGAAFVQVGAIENGNNGTVVRKSNIVAVGGS